MQEPTVTITITQFNVLKRALRSAKELRQRQMNGSTEKLVPPSRIAEIRKELCEFIDLEDELTEGES